VNKTVFQQPARAFCSQVESLCQRINAAKSNR
jgi:hypothetical protein